MPVRWETSERVSILESLAGSDIAPDLLGEYENEKGLYPMISASTLSKSMGQKSTVWQKILKTTSAYRIHLHGQPAKTRALSRSLFRSAVGCGRARRSHRRDGLRGLHSP